MSAVSERFIAWVDSNAFDYFVNYWIQEMKADDGYVDYLMERYDAGEKVNLHGVLEDIMKDEEALQKFFDWVMESKKWSPVFEDDAYTHFESCRPDEDMYRDR